MAGLTKQHFDEIANIFNNYGKSHKSFRELVEEFSNCLVTQNPTFEKARFIKACLK